MIVTPARATFHSCPPTVRVSMAANYMAPVNVRLDYYFFAVCSAGCLALVGSILLGTYGTRNLVSALPFRVHLTDHRRGTTSRVMIVK